MSSSAQLLVLYVDADAEACERFCALTSAHYVPVAANSAQHATRHLQSGKLAAVIVRVNQAQGNTLCLLEETATAAPRAVRLAVVSPRDVDDAVRATARGVLARHLVAPWDSQDMRALVDWAVEAYALGGQDPTLHTRLLQTERLATLGSLGAAMVHDLNQPLSYMTHNAERLAALARAAPALQRLTEGAGSGLDDSDRQLMHALAEELPAIASDMVTGAHVMRGLTQGVGELMRCDGRRPAAQCAPTKVIRYALAVCQDVAQKNRASLVYDGPESLPQVAVSSSDLCQILVNLMANGAHALAGNDPGTLRLRCRVLPQSLRFSVTDDGPGMSPDVLARVGTPFFSTRAEGTGLGVSQCRRLVERAGGDMAIESTQGLGTTVTFTLPKARAAQPVEA